MGGCLACECDLRDGNGTGVGDSDSMVWYNVSYSVRTRPHFNYNGFTDAEEY